MRVLIAATALALALSGPAAASPVRSDDASVARSTPGQDRILALLAQARVDVRVAVAWDLPLTTADADVVRRVARSC